MLPSGVHREHCREQGTHRTTGQVFQTMGKCYSEAKAESTVPGMF